MTPKGFRRKRVRLWAALYTRLFGKGDTDASEESDEEESEDGGEKRPGEETDP
jgi:hypothetical protein